MAASNLGDPESIRKLKEAAVAAAGMIENGAVVGLGSGSTAKLVVSEIGRRVKDGLRIIGVPTSEATDEQARGLGIALSTLAEHPRLDVDIDGADEVELGTLNLSKGGGGNLLREKLVAIASARFIVVVDERKLVDKIGMRSPVAVEVVPFGWQTTANRLRALGATPVLRFQADGQPYITDGGHCILDCSFGAIVSVSDLATQLDGVVGVVEHGLFIGLASTVVVSGPAGVKVLTAEDRQLR